MKLGFLTGLGLAAVSGMLAWPMSELGQWLAPIIDLPFSDWQTILIGVTFGALVMVPLNRAVSGRMLRNILLCIASFLIYMLATRLAIHQFYIENLSTELSMVLAGATGGLLVALAVSILANHPWKVQGPLLAAIAGALGGIPFAIFIYGTSDWLTVLCFVCWQTLVYIALYLAYRKPQNR